MKTLFKKHLHKIIIFSIGAIVIAGLVSCHYFSKEKKATKTSTITIAQQPTQNTLYFSGSIKPLTTIPVISPAEGVISNMYFSYGQHVKKGQPLFSIRSIKQQTTFQTTLANFLKTKQELNSSRGKMQETTKLYQQGLVSRNEFQQDKNAYYLNRLSFIQAQAELQEILKFHNMQEVSKLSISETDKINTVLSKFKQAEINITAPEDGIALFPTQTGNADGKMKTGSETKQGQVLLDIGDMHGIAIEVKVNELTINKIHPGQKTTITSEAFPNVTLNGYIKTIDAQATQSGNIPSFSVYIVIPRLTTKEQTTIHVGMSSKIEIKLKQKADITIPINAVTLKNGDSVVQVIDKNTSKIKDVVVTTGETTLKSVVITSGLNPGDQVVVHH